MGGNWDEWIKWINHSFISLGFFQNRKTTAKHCSCQTSTSPGAFQKALGNPPTFTHLPKKRGKNNQNQKNNMFSFGSNTGPLKLTANAPESRPKPQKEAKSIQTILFSGANMLVLGRVFVGKKCVSELKIVFHVFVAFSFELSKPPKKNKKKNRSVSWFHGGGLDPCVPWMQQGNLRLAGKITIPWRISGTSVLVSLARWWFQIFVYFHP